MRTDLLSANANPMPDVFAYLDYRTFLRDWYLARKQANPRFSYRVFARRAGQRSPSLLHHVMDGKRNLTPATTEAFSRAMGLRQSETDFFTYLVQLDQARTNDERNKAWERISATRRFREARQLEGEGFTYLSHWYYPAIRELSHRPDFVATGEWIASQLQPSVTVAQARKALEVLVNLGLVVLDGDGGANPSEASVVTPHEVAWLAVHNYHSGMMERARDAMSAIEPEERHFGGVTVAVPLELVPQLKEEIAAFQERLMDLCDSANAPKDRVYQLNLQLFPLSKLPESEETP